MNYAQCTNTLCTVLPWSVADIWGAAMGHELVPNEQTSSWCCDPLGLFCDRIFVRKHNKCLKIKQR